MGATSPAGDNDPAVYLAAALYEAKVTAKTAAQGFEWALFEHNEANRPAHVIRVITAHRKLLALHTPAPEDNRMWGNFTRFCPVCGEYDPTGPDGGVLAVPSPCDTLKLLAEAYGWTDSPASSERP